MGSKCAQWEREATRLKLDIPSSIFTASTIFLVDLLYHLPLTALFIFKFLTIFTWALP